MSTNPQFAPRSDPDFDSDNDPAYDPFTRIAAEDVYDAACSPLDFADEHMTQLGLTLDFGPRDLAANREGWLTDPQIERLESDLRWAYWPVIIALAVIAFVIGAGSITSGTFSAMPFVLLGLAAIPALMLKREREHLPDREVRATTLRIGRVSLTLRRWGMNDDAGPMGGVKLPVDGGKHIFAPKSVYKSLQSNQTYIVYYAPIFWTWRGYRLLSLEPMDAAKGKHPPRRKPKGKRG